MKREKENFFLVPNQIFMTKGEEEREKEIWWLEEEKKWDEKKFHNTFFGLRREVSGWSQRAKRNILRAQGKKGEEGGSIKIHVDASHDRSCKFHGEEGGKKVELAGDMPGPIEKSCEILLCSG
jgi:hypothetical protein